MLSKNKLKEIASLKDGKYRQIHNVFLAEGPKIARELLCSNARVIAFYALKEWDDEVHTAALKMNIPVQEITPAELKKISSLSTPNQVVAVVQIPPLALDRELLTKDLTLMLDGIRDPGNLGTIIRIADWFGITQVICSNDCVDLYNPKVIQASMGSFLRVRLFYDDLVSFLGHLPPEIPVYGALLDGDNLQDTEFDPHGILIIGNEANGISREILPLITHKLLIPSFPHPGNDSSHAESLNASVAAAILGFEFRKRHFSCQSHGHC